MLDIRRYRSPRLGSGDARLMMLYTRDGCTSDDGRLDVRDAMVFGVLVLLPGKRSRLRTIDENFDFSPHSLLGIFLGSHMLLV